MMPKPVPRTIFPASQPATRPTNKMTRRPSFDICIKFPPFVRANPPAPGPNLSIILQRDDSTLSVSRTVEFAAVRNQQQTELCSPGGEHPGAFRQDAPCNPVRPDLHVGRQSLEAAGLGKPASGRERTIGRRLVE